MAIHIFENICVYPQQEGSIMNISPERM